MDKNITNKKHKYQIKRFKVMGNKIILMISTEKLLMVHLNIL